MNEDHVRNSGNPDPANPDFVLNRWLHPSIYTAVPDPSRPLGYEAAVRAKVEAQRAILRDTGDAMRTSLEPERTSGEGEIDLGTEEGWQEYIEEHYREQEADQHAHADYMKHVEQIAQHRGQTLDEYRALEQAGAQEPEAGI